MNVLIKTLGFSLALILVFTAVSYVLPQMKGEAPEDRDVDVAALTMESFISLGEDLYLGKGTCTLCHNDLGRAPDLLKMDLASAFGERLGDSDDKGAAAVESYLRDSMTDPSAYVVAGFGKKGTNDTVSPMPVVNAPPIEMDEVQWRPSFIASAVGEFDDQTWFHQSSVGSLRRQH